MANGDRDSVVHAFHLPDYYLEERRAFERAGLAQAMEIIEAEIGQLEWFRPNRTPHLFLHVGLAGGEGTYWAQFPRTHTLIYDARFSRLERGYVKFVFCHVGDEWVLRSIEYGIPVRDPNARQRIERIMRDLTELANARRAARPGGRATESRKTWPSPAERLQQQV
jgi:hypothetical protein